MSALLERLGVELPVVQAGMGGGIARHELAAAVAEAGGLGTLGTDDPSVLERELQAARALTSKPIAVNLLLPFATPAHWRVARRADAVVTYWGRPLRRSPGVWLHQGGSLQEVLLARSAGADGVIVQGVEAGGHVRGRTPAHELLAQVRAALPAGYPLLLAGGIAERADVRAALHAGADAAVAGTRFLLSDESRAHAAYRRRALDADATLLTELFGFGWPAPHRVLRNAATDRWLGDEVRGPRGLLALNRLSGLGARRVPVVAQARLAAAQRAGRPLLSPAPATDDGPTGLVDAGPLYAGETVARIHEVRPAAALVAALTP